MALARKALKNDTLNAGTMSRTYLSWRSMKQRVLNPENPAYKNYGAKGVSIHPKWLTYSGFLEDIGVRPGGKTLDRVNSDGDYEPSNCRWASRVVQNNNRQNIKKYKGKSIAQWCRELGLKPSTVRQRVYVYGWSIERALK